MADGRSYGWCFTINNPHQDTDDLTPLESVSRYGVAGIETGEEGTLHIQGFVYFATKRSLAQLKKLLPRAHLERMRGTWEQAADYCKKENNFKEWGTPPMSKRKQGEKGKEFWDEQLSLAKKGRIEECDSKVQITHYNALNKIATRYAPMPADADDTTGIWYYGDTGTGKSRKARDENPGFYLKLANKWWDNYQGQDVAILEDFDKCHSVLGHHLKIWGDRYAFPAEIKGSQINIRPRKIIVTSNWHPKEIWPNEEQTLQPILRRFKINHFNLL